MRTECEWLETAESLGDFSSAVTNVKGNGCSVAGGCSGTSCRGSVNVINTDFTEQKMDRFGRYLRGHILHLGKTGDVLRSP